SENDGYGRGCSLGRLGGRRSEARDDDVRIGLDELGRQRGQAFRVPLRGAEVEDQILGLAVAELLEPLLHDHCLEVGGEGEIGHVVGLRWGLGARDVRWPSDCGAADERDEVASFHSTTSSAIASSLSGTVRPSAAAILRLITSSNLVGWITGISAGLA